MYILNKEKLEYLARKSSHKVGLLLYYYYYYYSRRIPTLSSENFPSYIIECVRFSKSCKTSFAQIQCTVEYNCLYNTYCIRENDLTCGL